MLLRVPSPSAQSVRSSRKTDGGTGAWRGKNQRGRLDSESDIRKERDLEKNERFVSFANSGNGRLIVNLLLLMDNG